MKKKRKVVAGKKTTSRKRRTNTWHALIKFAFAYCIVLTVLTGAYLTTNKNSISKIAQIDSLQLQTFYPTATPTPTSPPVDICNHHDDGHAVDPTCHCAQYLVHCENKTCKEIDMSKSGMLPPITCDDTHPPRFLNFDWCNYPGTAQTDGWFCLGKPVIYLYPKSPLYVDVSVNTSGSIVISDPAYPTGGWKNVYAEPSGKLNYQGKQYRELFYESSVTDFGKPQKGITLHASNLRAELDNVITELGLVNGEKTEFLDWWVPKLEALKKPYIQFSVISQDEKEKVDHVDISPRPDTMIQFIAYFKGLSSPYPGPALELPSIPPERIGFTAVEWGGTIDNN
ncbi:MAG: hypothetical protein ACM3IJ_00870 [Candidatus Levyibacteriota bacterium]